MMHAMRTRVAAAVLVGAVLVGGCGAPKDQERTDGGSDGSPAATASTAAAAYDPSQAAIDQAVRAVRFGRDYAQGGETCFTDVTPSCPNRATDAEESAYRTAIGGLIPGSANGRAVAGAFVLSFADEASAARRVSSDRASHQRNTPRIDTKPVGDPQKNYTPGERGRTTLKPYRLHQWRGFVWAGRVGLVDKAGHESAPVSEVFLDLQRGRFVISMSWYSTDTMTVAGSAENLDQLTKLVDRLDRAG